MQGRQTDVRFRRRIWLLRPALELGVVVAIASVAGVLLLDAQRSSGHAWVDGGARWMADLHGQPWLNHSMAWVTSFGAEIFLFGAFSALVVWSYRSRGRTWGRFSLLVMGGALALDNIVKPLVARPRPDIDQLVNGRGASFPSGHVVATTALLFALAFYISSGTGLRTRNRIWVVAIAGVTLMAASRVYLGVHWPTDVIAGVCIGAAWTYLCARSQKIGPRRASSFSLASALRTSQSRSVSPTAWRHS